MIVCATECFIMSRNEHFSKLFISYHIISPTLIKWWFRYVDDVHSVIRKDQVNKLQDHINSIDPHIKFTIELLGTDGLPFLDTLTKPTPNSTESTVYRKPMHTDRYLDYSSTHHIAAKLSVIHTLIHRAKQVCSTPEFLPKEMEHLNKVLQDNHYPAQFFQQDKPQQKAKPIHRKVYRRKLELSYHPSKASVNSTDTPYQNAKLEFSLNVPAPLNLYSCIHKIQFQMLRKLTQSTTGNTQPTIVQLNTKVKPTGLWEKEFQTIDIKPPVPSETTTSPQNTQR